VLTYVVTTVERLAWSRLGTLESNHVRYSVMVAYLLLDKLQAAVCHSEPIMNAHCRTQRRNMLVQTSSTQSNTGYHCAGSTR
jgi:hypothetical protein